MARYVVLKFDDNAAARKFCKQLQEGMPEDLVSLPTWATDLVSFLRSGIEVSALAPAPTQFCDCGARGKLKRRRGSFKGAKTGWWVCEGCGKPIVHWGKSYKAVLSAAHNFLAGEGPKK